MKTIHKYGLSIGTTTVIKLPTNTQVLLVDEQDDTPCMWVELDTSMLTK